jgi:hypothetical protein
MHGTALTGTQRRTRLADASGAGRLWARALKNGLARNRASGSRTHSSSRRSASLRDGGDWARRSLIHRPRTGLGHDHARGRRLHHRRRRRSRRTGRNHLGWRRRCRSCNHRRGWWRHNLRRRGRTNRRRNCWRRCNRRRCNRKRCNRNRSNRNWRNCRPLGRSRNRGPHRRCGRNRRRRRRSDGPGYRNRCHGLGHNCGRRGRRCGARRRPRQSFFPLGDGLQHISRTGDLRQIDLGLDFFFAAQRARGSRGRGLRIGGGPEVSPYLFCFMLFQ